MRNIRSVMRKPPTTFVDEQATAMSPITLLAVRSAEAPATMSEPTNEMPDIALVADISGVCSSGGTRVITW